MNDTERLAAWRDAREGTARIVIGTRSAVFTPLLHPGLIIIDEEHDGSFKQQDGFRYSARDLALVRAQRLGIPIVLGSATPSLETLARARKQPETLSHLPNRAGSAKPPQRRPDRSAQARRDSGHRYADRRRPFSVISMPADR